MAENFDPNDADAPPVDGDVPVEEIESDEESAPRRAASAQFVVKRDVGSIAAMRAAMDPANQSLAEALRLSYRVLQVVILVLVVLFFFSGFQTVDKGQSGVLTRWGKIIDVDGQEALEPGLKFSKWPYPIGEFILFDIENRSVSLRDVFWPRIPPGTQFDQAAENAPDELQPGDDGSLLTRDGGLAHLRLGATYEIESPESFVRSLKRPDTDRIVELALQRAVVHVVGELDLQSLIEFSDDTKERIRRMAQAKLDEFDCGLRLVNVSPPEAPRPPLAIVRAWGELQLAKVNATESIERARQNANETLVGVAGRNYVEIIRRIETYEDALELADDARAEEALVGINEVLESEDVAGEVSEIIQYAKAYRSQVESTLGSEAQRFKTLLPTFREHPELVVKERWMDAYKSVFARRDAEVFRVPPDLGMINLMITGLDEVQQTRRKMKLDRGERAAREAEFRGRPGPYIKRAEDYEWERQSRQLNPDATGFRENQRP